MSIVTTVDVSQPADTSRENDSESSVNGVRWIECSDRTRVIAVLESSKCVAFSRTNEELKRFRNENLLRYELESWLPIDGDAIALNRVRGRSSSLVVCTDGSTMAEAMADREVNGQFVVGICPQIFLALKGLARSAELRHYDLVIWHSPTGTDLIRLESGQPIQWHWTPGDLESTHDRMRDLASDQDALRILCVDASEGFAETVSGNEDTVFLVKDQTEAAHREATRILNGTSSPWVDLRNGILKPIGRTEPFRRPLAALLVSALISQAMLLGALTYRRWQIESDVDDLVAAQTEAYRTVFPEGPVPVGILSRLTSEERELAGLKGGGGGRSVPKLMSVLPMWLEVLAGLPDAKESRYQIDRLELSPQTISVAEGTARTIGDLEEVASKLRSRGFRIPPISVAKTRDGVALRFEDVELVDSERGS